MTRPADEGTGASGAGLPAAEPRGLRWRLAESELQPLLAEAARGRGHGLARLAWRRLLARRSARWSLAFLAALGLVALLAPFWPLPSPIALDLSGEPRPPRLAGLLDLGWQHRVSLELRLPEAPARARLARLEPELVELIGRAAGERPRLVRHGTDGAVESLELAFPYRSELDPLRGSNLEQRARTLLDPRLVDGRWLDPGGDSIAVELAGVRAAEGYWELGRLDSALLGLRRRCFGLWQTTHWMGTDSKGRDLLARLVWGSRVSLQVALAAALVSLGVGVLYGALAGLLGGWVDALMMRLVDVLYSMPFLFVVIFVITLLDGYRDLLERRLGIGRMTAFFAVLGLVSWLTMARVVRGQVLALREREFVQAARVLGASRWRILRVHLVPNLLGVVIVYLTLTIPSVMLLEAFLSFLGLGVEAPRVSWGLLAVDAIEAINPLVSFWWLVLWPSLAMGATLLALNVLGDGLRDALDPRHAHLEPALGRRSEP